MTLNCLSRVINLKIKRHGLILSSTPKLYIVQTANITSKEWRDPNIKKPAPWPYKTKRYTYFKSFYEGTVKRFDENTKIIVVEGNIGAGKNAFAKQLAETFEMVYVPEPTMEKAYKTAYGYDLRELDPILPASQRSCELSTFYKNPHDMNVPKFQYRMFIYRLENYIDALSHVLNTGQGIVMERSVYSDFVFMEAMFKAGYFRKEFREYYNLVQNNTLDELMKPNLIIYLDVTPEVALERIKAKNDPVEVNSPVLTKEYLESIEYFYKQEYLRKMEPHSELLIYDWNNFGDVEVVVEDIERIDFERFTKYETKLKDWRKFDDWEWGYWRRRYTNERHKIMGYAEIFKPHIHEIFSPTQDIIAYENILKKVPGEKYAEGFNPDCGDNVLLKTQHKGYWYNYYHRIQE